MSCDIRQLNVRILKYNVLTRAEEVAEGVYSRATSFEVLEFEWIDPERGKGKDIKETIIESYPLVSAYLIDHDRDAWYQARFDVEGGK